MKTLLAVLFASALFAGGCHSPKPSPAPGAPYPITRFVDPVTEKVPNVR